METPELADGWRQVSGAPRIDVFQVGHREHLLDRSNTGDRLRREAPGVGYRAHEFTVDRDRAPAHPGQNSRRRQRAARETRENQVLVGADVGQLAEDLDVEGLDLCAEEDGPARAQHSRPDVLERERRNRGRSFEASRERGQKQRRGEPPHALPILSIMRWTKRVAPCRLTCATARRCSSSPEDPPFRRDTAEQWRCAPPARRCFSPARPGSGGRTR